MRRATLVKAWCSLLASLALLFVCVGVIAFVSAPTDSPMGFAAAIIVVGSIFLGVPVSIAIANDYFERAGALKRQLHNAEVIVCEGLAEDLAGPPPVMTAIARQLDGRPEVRLEVLVPSGLVWTINGRPERSWTIAPTGRTAGTPEHARLAARYVRPVETDSGTVHVHRRPLSDEERSELRGYVRNIPVGAILILLLLNTGAASQMLLYAGDPGGAPVVGVVLVTGAAWCDVQFVAAMRRRRRMLHDLHEGFVVIYQPDFGGDAADDSVVEFLPHTRAEWTSGGRAADWRRVYGMAMLEPGTRGATR
jgi:hypothetical protein